MTIKKQSHRIYKAIMLLLAVLLIGSLLFFLLTGCCRHPKSKTAIRQDKPNIVWIVTEDISPILPAYGDHTAKTPNFDPLATG